jgi:ribosomal protein S12 methylthiotransferase
MIRSKAKDRPRLSVGFVSLGCPKNLVDSQIMADVLLTEGVRLAPSPEKADAVIVNTCAFIDAARRESMDAIRAVCRLKRQGRCRAVLVCGCLPQRYKGALKAGLPAVDAFVGLDELRQIGAIVKRLAGGERDIVAVSDESHALFDPDGPGVSFTGGPFAYVKIAEGCNHRCSFCAIPGIRGRFRSRPLRGIVREAERHLSRGMKELNLVSQDITAYGRDLADGTDLCGLLTALGRLGGSFWIRLLYAYPTRVSARLLETMAAVPQVCHYLDVPIQHSAPAMLRAMRRADTIRPVAQLAGRARAVLPDVALRTTCLVGFPGETEADFAHLLRHLRTAQYDHVGAFVYSPEEDTPAFGMPRVPPREVAEERRRRLMLAQKRVVARKAAARVGTEAEVLIERPVSPGGRVWAGRSRRDAPRIDGEVFVRGVPAGIKPGAFVPVRYTAPADYDMKAVAV